MEPVTIQITMPNQQLANHVIRCAFNSYAGALFHLEENRKRNIEVPDLKFRIVYMKKEDPIDLTKQV